MRRTAIATFLVGPLLVGGLASADPFDLALRAVRQADPGAGGGPAPSTPSLFGDVTGPAEPAPLADLLERAVRTAPALAQAEVDRAVAEAAIAQAQAWDEWAVDATGSAAIRHSLGTDLRSISLEGSIGRRIFTGGTVGVTVGSDWERSVRTSEVSGMTITQRQAGYTEAITATFSQPLLRGRGRAQTLAGVRAAQIDRDAVTLAADAAMIGVVRELVLAYFDLAQAERELEIVRGSLALTRERLRVTQAGIAAGGTARAETIAVEQAIATREEEILADESTITTRSIALRRLAGMPIGPGQLVLATQIELAIPARTWDVGALLGAAVRNSPELARLRALEAGASIEVEVTENGVLPSLDLALSVGPSGTDDDPGSATVNLVTVDDFTAAASLTYRTSIGQGAAKAVARQARARRESVRVTADDVRAQIAQSITLATLGAITAERRFAIATRAIGLAEQNLAAEQARLSSGKSRNVDVLQRQDELRAAQLRAARAILDWHRAATAIDALTGDLLPQYGVSRRAR